MIFKWNNKQKKQDCGIQIQSLTNQEHGVTRSLWENTFDEDSKEFVDFYYNNKVTDNSIWVAKENELVLSMAQLNPYQIHFCASEILVHYIVGVATMEEYRRQGLMKGVLEASFWQMYHNQEPFTYLMPAKEEYYSGFDFVSVYYQKKGVLIKGNAESKLICKDAREEDLEELARFSEVFLSPKCKVYTVRSKSYYQILKTQFETEHGGIECVYDGNKLIGYFFYGVYDTIEVMEPVCLSTYKNEFAHAIVEKFQDMEKVIQVTAFDFLNEDDMKCIVAKPATMVRIINLETFVGYLRAIEPIELVVEITDSFIEPNNGVFHIQIDSQHARLERISQEPEFALTIKELCAICFYEDISKLMEERISKEIIEKLRQIIKFNPVFLNEFV